MVRLISRKNKIGVCFIFVTFFQFFVSGYLYAQEVQKVAKNAIYIEGLGNGIFYSLNYERSIQSNISIRSGLSYFVLFGEAEHKSTGEKEEVFAEIVTSPIMLNYFIGKGNHKVEIGGGMVLFSLRGQSSEVSSNGIKFKVGVFSLLTGTLGWRYQPRGGGLVFKVAFTPIFNFGDFLPFGGIGIGYAF